MKTAEIETLGWTNEEAAEAWGQVCLGFGHGGHDMKTRSKNRCLLYLAAWLEAIDEDEDEDEGRLERFKMSEGPRPPPYRGPRLSRRRVCDRRGGRQLVRFCLDGLGSTSSPENPQLHIERITRKTVPEHPLFAPWLDAIYEKSPLQKSTLRATHENVCQQNT